MGWTTTPENLIGLAKDAGSITANLTFPEGVAGWEASSLEGGFVTVPSSGTGSDRSLTISYPENTDAAPRTDTVTIRLMSSLAGPSSQKLPILQLGTAAAIVGDFVLDSAKAITSEVRAAKYILGNLTIGDEVCRHRSHKY